MPHPESIRIAAAYIEGDLPASYKEIPDEKLRNHLLFSDNYILPDLERELAEYPNSPPMVALFELGIAVGLNHQQVLGLFDQIEEQDRLIVPPGQKDEKFYTSPDGLRAFTAVAYVVEKSHRGIEGYSPQDMRKVASEVKTLCGESALAEWIQDPLHAKKNDPESVIFERVPAGVQ